MVYDIENRDIDLCASYAIKRISTEKIKGIFRENTIKRINGTISTET